MSERLKKTNISILALIIGVVLCLFIIPSAPATADDSTPLSTATTDLVAHESGQPEETDSQRENIDAGSIDAANPQDDTNSSNDSKTAAPVAAVSTLSLVGIAGLANAIRFS